MSTLDRLLTTRAKGSSVDLAPIHSAANLADLCAFGGKLMLETKGNANLAAIQLAMRQRAQSLSHE